MAPVAEPTHAVLNRANATLRAANPDLRVAHRCGADAAPTADTVTRIKSGAYLDTR